MASIEPINPKDTTDKEKDLLDGVQTQFRMVPKYFQDNGKFSPCSRRISEIKRCIGWRSLI
jgi:hypothetical protein